VEFIQARNYTRVGSPARSIDLIVIHTMEYPERPTGAEWCANYFAGVSAPKASAHYMVDNDTIVQGVRDEDVAWAAPGANSNGIQIEHTGYAAQSKPNWEDPFSAAMLELSAKLTAKLCARHNIPVRFVDVDGLKRGVRGITTHNAVSLAFRRSNHTDPGPNFPMAAYLAAVKAVTAPEPPKEVDIVEAWVPAFIEWYLFNREGPRPVSAPLSIPQRVWDVIGLAARFRAEKPADNTEVNILKAKIAAALKDLA
jgi:hypothetical protein